MLECLQLQKWLQMLLPGLTLHMSNGVGGRAVLAETIRRTPLPSPQFTAHLCFTTMLRNVMLRSIML